MRKIFACLFTVLFISFSTTYHLTTTTVDFKNYNWEGFLITTSSIGSAYESLGIVDVSCQPGYVPRQAKPEKEIAKEDDVYGSFVASHTSGYFNCTKADLIDAIYSQAKDLKANAIVDLKFSEYTIKTETGLKVVYTATGLAISIKYNI